MQNIATDPIQRMLAFSEKALFAPSSPAERQVALSTILNAFDQLVKQVVDGPLRHWKRCQIQYLGVECEQGHLIEDTTYKFEQLLQIWLNADSLARPPLFYENWRMTLKEKLEYLLASSLIFIRQPPLVMENNQERKEVEKKTKATAIAKFLPNLTSKLGDRIKLLPNTVTLTNPNYELVLLNNDRQWESGGWLVDAGPKKARVQNEHKRPNGRNYVQSDAGCSQMQDDFTLKFLNINVKRASNGSPKQRYHIRVCWLFSLDNQPLTALHVVSLPFLIRTGNIQDVELNQTMLSDYVLSDEFVEDLELLPVRSDSTKPWERWANTLNCFFYKHAGRYLREDELHMLAVKLGVIADGKQKSTILQQYGASLMSEMNEMLRIPLITVNAVWFCMLLVMWLYVLFGLLMLCVRVSSTPSPPEEEEEEVNEVSKWESVMGLVYMVLELFLICFTVVVGFFFYHELDQKIKVAKIKLWMVPPVPEKHQKEANVAPASVQQKAPRVVIADSTRQEMTVTGKSAAEQRAVPQRTILGIQQRMEEARIRERAITDAGADKPDDPEE